MDFEKAIDEELEENEEGEVKTVLLHEEDIKALQKLVKWSTTNIKNISNYEQDLNLLTNQELITILKTSKTNLKENKVNEGQNLKLITNIEKIDINFIKSLIKKMNKYYLICIGLGLIQKKILSERLALVNFNYIQKEIQKLKEFKSFLLDYQSKQSELQTLTELEEYFIKIEKVIGAKKK